VSAVERLSCQELVELITSYLEDALPADERRRFDEHIGDCEGCRNYLEQMRITVRLLGGITIYDLDVDAEDALLHTFRNWKSR
jgi:anti-sigma factor RsiW